MAATEQAKHTAGPWKPCGASRGGCQCGQVWCRDYPVAIVTRGEWGDGLDLRRAVRELWAHLRHKGFGFLAYGAVSKEHANANARLIAAAPELLETAKAALAFYDAAEIPHLPGEERVLDNLQAAIAKAEA